MAKPKVQPSINADGEAGANDDGFQKQEEEADPRASLMRLQTKLLEANKDVDDKFTL